jgi:hypothetical protein
LVFISVTFGYFERNLLTLELHREREVEREMESNKSKGALLEEMKEEGDEVGEENSANLVVVDTLVVVQPNSPPEELPEELPEESSEESPEESSEEGPLRDPKARAPLSLDDLVPSGSTLEGTIRLRREQLADVCELLSELLCADEKFMLSKEALERAVSSLRKIAITVENKPLTTSLLRAPPSTWSIVPPLRWATTLTNLGLVERALGCEEVLVRCVFYFFIFFLLFFNIFIA